ncbi:MAG: hypothetical protein ACJ762_13085 [Solirubrobacteraceae bacterium]
MSTSAEHQTREGAPPNDGPVEGLPGPSAETDRDAPSGMPEDAPEGTPLGTTDEKPEGDAEPQRGEDAMPGIPTEGEPPAAS